VLQTEWRTASRDKLITELERQQREIERLRREHERADQDRNRYRQQRDQLQRKIDRLEDELDEARRALHRQAAPFSRGIPQRPPRRPGRKAGVAYGRRAHRAAPTHIDETYEAPLPSACPACGGPVTLTRHAMQYQEDLPVVRPRVRAFHIAVGHCRGCGHRVQGRHPLQTSDTQEVLASVLRTIQQRHGDTAAILSTLLRSPHPLTALAPSPTIQ
jgi:hypothetical protein